MGTPWSGNKRQIRQHDVIKAGTVAMNLHYKMTLQLRKSTGHAGHNGYSSPHRKGQIKHLKVDFGPQQLRRITGAPQA